MKEEVRRGERKRRQGVEEVEDEAGRREGRRGGRGIFTFTHCIYVTLTFINHLSVYTLYIIHLSNNTADEGIRTRLLSKVRFGILQTATVVTVASRWPTNLATTTMTPTLATSPSLTPCGLGLTLLKTTPCIWWHRGESYIKHSQQVI